MHTGDITRYIVFGLIFEIWKRSVTSAPITPARPVPEDHPETKSLGKFLKYPKIVASPKAEPVPIMKLGMSERKNASVLSKFPPSTEFSIKNKDTYPVKK